MYKHSKLWIFFNKNQPAVPNSILFSNSFLSWSIFPFSASICISALVLLFYKEGKIVYIHCSMKSGLYVFCFSMLNSELIIMWPIFCNQRFISISFLTWSIFIHSCNLPSTSSSPVPAIFWCQNVNLKKTQSEIVIVKLVKSAITI